MGRRSSALGTVTGFLIRARLSRFLFSGLLGLLVSRLVLAKVYIGFGVLTALLFQVGSAAAQPWPAPVPVQAQAQAQAETRNASPGQGQNQGQTSGQNQGQFPVLDLERERAAEAFQEALVAFQNSDFGTARQRYEEAYRLSPHPNTLYNLALACERLLDYDAAIAAFHRFLDEPLLSDPQAARLQETRRVLAERSLRRLEGLPARVSISAVPEHLTASVALVPVSAERPPAGRCDTPCILTVPAGNYRLTLQGIGYFPEEVEFQAHVGQALLISRQLRPKPRRVQIESQPRAQLYLDDRLLGSTPYVGDVTLGSHRIRLERRLYLTQLRTIEVADHGPPRANSLLRFPVNLEPSGRVDMIIAGAMAGAGVGLMVLRLLSGVEFPNGSGQGYDNLATALTLLPAVLGASVAGLAGWEMPANQAQLLIGSAAWGTIISFGIGLGAQPQNLVPDLLAVGGGLIGGTIGTAVNRYMQPSSGAVAVFNSVALWSSVIGSLGWAYLISEYPDTSFYGPSSSSGRVGTGGWVMLGSSLGGVMLGIGLSQLHVAGELTRSQVALVDLGAALGGLAAGGLGMGIGYLTTGGSWNDTIRIAVPSAIAGIGVGLASAALLVNSYRHRHHDQESRPASSPLPLQSGPPQLSLGRDIGGGISVGVSILDGRF
jgi:hypothetical protein